MIQKTRKILCLISALLIVVSFDATSLAVETATDDISLAYAVSSPEFPDAHVIIEKTDGEINESGSAGTENGCKTTVSATVFVEESHQLVDGEVIITDSRLLSEHEVNAIGMENFESLETQKIDASMFSSIDPNAAVNNRGKLTITCEGRHSVSGNSVTCNLTGNAYWSGFNFFYNPENNPAVGKDFIGYAWSGGFECPTSSAAATWWSTGDPQNIYLCDATPNAGRVWEFDEILDLDSAVFYVDNINVNAILKKENMTGNGNNAEAMMKYIHTYQKVTGGINISASPSDVGSGFTLSNTPKSWGLVVIITGIPY